MAANSIFLPILSVAFTNGTTSTCVRSVCRDAENVDLVRLKCTMEPRLVEGGIWNASTHGDCPKDRTSFISSIQTTSIQQGWLSAHGDPNYPGTCTFASEACAVQVCSLQASQVNTTSNKEFNCKSDPAVAAAAVAGTYWFDLNNRTQNVQTDDTTSPCKDQKPSCRGIKYVNANGTTVTSGVVPHHPPTALALLAIVSGLVGLIAASGFAGA